MYETTLRGQVTAAPGDTGVLSGSEGQVVEPRALRCSGVTLLLVLGYLFPKGNTVNQGWKGGEVR